MELLYVWIGDYRCIKDLSLNFTNQYRFSYNPKANSLDIIQNKNYIPGFFSKNISNFTGLIGSNGAGKTTILRFILDFHTNGLTEKDLLDTILVFKRQEKFYYYSHNALILTGIGDSIELIRINEITNINEAYNIVYLSNQFDPTSYYSNDITKEELKGVKNVSSWYLLANDFGSKTGLDSKKKDITFNKIVEAFATMEFMRIVKVLRWINKNKDRNPFPVEMPPYINLKLNFNQESPFKDQLIELTQKLQGYFKIKRSSKDLFLLRAFEASLYHLLDESKFVVGPELIVSKYELLIKALSGRVTKNKTIGSSENSIIQEINNLISYIKDFKGLEIFQIRLEQIQKFLNILTEFVQGQYSRVDHTGSVLGISIKNVKLTLLEDLIDIYYNVEKVGEYADFYFSHNYFSESSLSSGEYSLLSIFGRLNNLKLERKKTILLLIDEAELALHPEWQKQFISRFIEFVSEKFKQNKVQIILTSHSPFILSDLPPHCCILLKRLGNKVTVVNNLESKSETFGANIHELFTDSFFLQDSLMGDFARKKIEKLIERVNSKDRYTLEDYYSLNKEIDIIGEPFIRFKLLEKIMNGLPKEHFDGVIVEREKELMQLRNIRNDKN